MRHLVAIARHELVHLCLSRTNTVVRLGFPWSLPAFILFWLPAPHPGLRGKACVPYHRSVGCVFGPTILNQTDIAGISKSCKKEACDGWILPLPSGLVLF